ncbi:MAG: sigma-70 family RNA polymerase sigma factor [Oscillospiraceae bacterium]|nr:sigma-70 family RNA polymerase sigma factor [Oscillospiraceae bacterium]
MQESDRLIKRAQNGDSEAYEQLILPMEQRIYTLCYRITNNREDAFDCAQEVMLRAYRAIGEYRFHASFATWVYRITTNVCLDMIRRRRIKPFVSLEGMMDAGFSVTDRSNNPQEILERNDLNQTLKECIARLPLDMRTAIILRDIQGLTYEEVAQVLRLNLGTVKSRISRARERLRQMLSVYASGGMAALNARNRKKDNYDKYEEDWEQN